MQITDDMTLEEIQQQFEEKFPYLKLEFYEGKHKEGEGSSATEKIYSKKKIGEVTKKSKKGDFIIDPDMTVAELEKMFHDQYGLNTQVHRMSGNVWLQTTTTDEWTLTKQNTKGENSVKAYKEKYGE